MASSWARLAESQAVAAFDGQGDPLRAEGAFAYMKRVAPFLGIDATTRRRLLKAAWAELPDPSSAELGAAAKLLMRREEREFHYAAYDLIAWREHCADESFLPAYGKTLITTKPWWDTVDGLVTAMVSPLCRRYGHADLIEKWSESGVRWLVRAAIGHQRGWKADSDTAAILALCDRHWGDPEFFVAKAIGWALRDLTAIDARAVRKFLLAHDGVRNTVAVREAERGLSRL